MTTNKQNADNKIEISLGWIYDQITGDEDSRVCKDIPDSACRHQPRNFFAYLIANLLGKIADELASARLTLPWLLSALGAPGSFAGFLVPIRESGVLVPQLIVAAYIRRMAIRKTVWLIGAGLSGLVMLLMALTTRLDGSAAGWAILVLLVVYSLARGLCSVSAKDVLGKTVSKTRRGALMGYSVAISSAAVFILGLYLLQEDAQLKSNTVFFILFFAAAIFWVIALIVFAQIKEVPGATEGGGNAVTEAIKSFSLLKTDQLFRRFVLMRFLLLSIALLPPFLVILAQENTQGNLVSLGWLIIANGLAGVVTGVIWGKLSDYSSRLTMIIGSLIASITGITLWLLSVVGHSLMESSLSYTIFFFLITIAHGGVRLGRKVYLVDMSNEQTRSSYVALSNTVIGLAILLAGSIGFLAELLTVSHVILLLSAIALLAAFYAWRIQDVSG